MLKILFAAIVAATACSSVSAAPAQRPTPIVIPTEPPRSWGPYYGTPSPALLKQERADEEAWNAWCDHLPISITLNDDADLKNVTIRGPVRVVIAGKNAQFESSMMVGGCVNIPGTPSPNPLLPPLTPACVAANRAWARNGYHGGAPCPVPPPPTPTAQPTKGGSE